MSETKNKITCGAVEHLLVDYADDLLVGPEATAIRRHIEGCGACRTEVAALRRSLVLARSVWKESAGSVLAISANGRVIAKRSERRRGPLAWAACGAAAAGVLLCWKTFAPPPIPTVAREAAHTEGPPTEEAVVDPADPSSLDVIEDADIEAFIEREEQAARLAMSIRILAEAPNVNEDVARANGYLRTVWSCFVKRNARR